MKLNEFREILTQHCDNVGFGIEVHKNDFMVLTNYVIVNRVITLNDITEIKLVGDELTDDENQITVWFNKHHITLSDIKTLDIGRVRSYL